MLRFPGFEEFVQSVREFTKDSGVLVYEVTNQGDGLYWYHARPPPGEDGKGNGHVVNKTAMIESAAAPAPERPSEPQTVTTNEIGDELLDLAVRIARLGRKVSALRQQT